MAASIISASLGGPLGGGGGGAALGGGGDGQPANQSAAINRRSAGAIVRMVI